jgi:hypothetical protein
MKSSASIALILLAAAQAAEPPVPLNLPISHFQGLCRDDKTFADRACYTNFDPGQAGFGLSYRPPTCDTSTPVTDRQREVIAAAYRRAPDYAQTRLCQLTQLFVAPSSQGSWSFWEGPDRPPGKGVYIGISEWKLASEMTFADAENETTDELLGLEDSNGRNAQRLPRLHTTSRPDSGLTVLATLAHELGHLLLSDSNADGIDPGHPRRKVSGPPRSACFEGVFLALSWNADMFRQHMRRWVGFGDQNQNERKNPDLQFDLKQLRTAVQEDKLDIANDAITRIYESREFVSFFASVSPEEDFVETYKYKVLADVMANQPVGLQLRGQEINVLDFVGKGIPAKKVECLRELGLLTSRP